MCLYLYLYLYSTAATFFVSLVFPFSSAAISNVLLKIHFFCFGSCGGTSGGSFAVEVGEFVAGFGEFGGGTFVGGNVGGSFGLEVVGGTAVLRSSSAA